LNASGEHDILFTADPLNHGTAIMLQMPSNTFEARA